MHNAVTFFNIAVPLMTGLIALIVSYILSRILSGGPLLFCILFLSPAIASSASIYLVTYAMIKIFGF